MAALHSPVLSMEGVCLSFGPKRVLDGLAFAVARGECFGFLGPSGAGKTTTIKLLTRQLAADTGRIALFGRPIEHASGADYDRIGILSDTSALYERLSIEENLRLYARLRGGAGRGVDGLLERVGLERDRGTLVKNCSKGMRQRAALLAALVHSPELVFLDEPTSGLDPAARAEVHRMLAELRRAGTTGLSHHARHGGGRGPAATAWRSSTRGASWRRARRLRLPWSTRATASWWSRAPRGVVELTKDAAAADAVRDLLAAGEVASIHSDEPNLEEVFLELTEGSSR